MELHIEIIAPNGVQVKQIFSSIDVTEDEDGELEKLTKQVQAGGIISLITEDGALMLNTSKLVSLDALKSLASTFDEDGEEDGTEEVYTVDIVMSVQRHSSSLHQKDKLGKAHRLQDCSAVDFALCGRVVLPKHFGKFFRRVCGVRLLIGVHACCIVVLRLCYPVAPVALRALLDDGGKVCNFLVGVETVVALSHPVTTPQEFSPHRPINAALMQKNLGRARLAYHVTHAGEYLLDDWFSPADELCQLFSV